MAKSRILQILAFMLILIGGYMVFTGLSEEDSQPAILSGVGSLLIGGAMMYLSTIKGIAKRE